MICCFHTCLPIHPTQQNNLVQVQIKMINFLVKALHHLSITLGVKSKLFAVPTKLCATLHDLTDPASLSTRGLPFLPLSYLAFTTLASFVFSEHPGFFSLQSLCICLVHLPGMFFPQIFTWLPPYQKVPPLTLDGK